MHDPSAGTGTNVSVLFFDKAATADKVILIDASKLGEEYKDTNGLKKVRLTDAEIDKIVNAFKNKENIEDFSVAVTYDEIREKGYSLSAGLYFDIKIDYIDITEEEFQSPNDEIQINLSGAVIRALLQILLQVDFCASVEIYLALFVALAKHHALRGKAQF